MPEMLGSCNYLTVVQFYPACLIFIMSKSLAGVIWFVHTRVPCMIMRENILCTAVAPYQYCSVVFSALGCADFFGRQNVLYSSAVKGHEVLMNSGL